MSQPSRLSSDAAQALRQPGAVEGHSRQEMTARLYGNVLGFGSLAVVTAGFRSVLSNEHLLSGVYGVDTPEDDTHSSSAAAPWGIYTGSLSHVSTVFQRGRHAHQAIMLAPNSTELPRDLVRLLKGYAHRSDVKFLAPSRWASGVVSELLEVPCLTVPHGVHRAFRVDEEIAAHNIADYAEGKIRVMHFSTSARERKGTFELLLAWEILRKRCSALKLELLCVMDYLAEQRLREALMDVEMEVPEGVRLIGRAEISHETMARNLSRAHLVCQPSRGEAFGLVPLEALACGVPVVATECTGHSEYLSINTPGVEVIPTGGLGQIDDLPGALAPTLSVEGIAKHLEMALCGWPLHQLHAVGNAPEIQKRWSWEASLAPFVLRLKEQIPW